MVDGLPPESSLSQPQSGVEPRAVQSGEWALRAVIGQSSVFRAGLMKPWAELIYFRCKVLDYHSRLKRLEALFYGSSALRCSYSWKRTHDAFMKGDDDASDVEECTTECEAEFMQEGYEKLCEELRERVEEIGVKESPAGGHWSRVIGQWAS